MRREFHSDATVALNSGDIRVQLVIEIMHQNFASDLAWSELASRVGLSQSRLRHLFTAQTGMSPQQVFAQLRLTRAKELLATTELTIEQVALRVGWQDRSHFERRFKQTLWHYSRSTSNDG